MLNWNQKRIDTRRDVLPVPLWELWDTLSKLLLVCLVLNKARRVGETLWLSDRLVSCCKFTTAYPLVVTQLGLIGPYRIRSSGDII